MEADEHPKPQTTKEQLAKLPTVFKKDGVVTAGSASGICDGAAAVIGKNSKIEGIGFKYMNCPLGLKH